MFGKTILSQGLLSVSIPRILPCDVAIQSCRGTLAMPGRDLFALPIVALDNFGTHHCVMTAGNGVSKEH